MARRRRRGRKGEGSVTYDKTTRSWAARFPIGRFNGRTKFVKARAATEEGALEELDRLRRTHGRGGDPATMTLDVFLQDWLRSVRPAIRESTYISFEGHVKLHISPLLGGIIVAKLRPADVRRLIADRLAAGKSPSTVRHIISTLSNALQQAVNDRSIPDNPARGVPLPRIEDKLVHALTEDDAARIEEAVRETWLEPIIALLLGSGIRLGEALALNQEDVSIDPPYVVIRKSKTRLRAVSISDDAAAVLDRHIKSLKRIGDKEPVFVGGRSRERIRVDTVTHAFPAMLEAAGLPRMTPHALRHGVATLMAAKGVPMRVISEQLGHANPAFTARTYAHVAPETTRTAVKSLNRRRKPA